MSLTFVEDAADYYLYSGNPIGTYPFTFACRVRTTASSNNRIPLGVKHISTTGLYCFIRIDGSTNTVSFVYRSGFLTCTTTNTVTDGQWATVVVVALSATDRRIYANADEANFGQSTSSFGDIGGANQAYIGVGGDGGSLSQPFNGDIADVVFYANYAWTASDRAAFHAGLSPLLIAPHACTCYVPGWRSDSTLYSVIGSASFASNGSPSTSTHLGISYPNSPKIRIGTTAEETNLGVILSSELYAGTLYGNFIRSGLEGSEGSGDFRFISNNIYGGNIRIY